MAVLQVVERPSADGGSTQVEAVPNPEQTSAADFRSGEAWPLLTGAQDILLIASSFAADGFDVREVTLVDRYFRVADDDEAEEIAEAVLRYITSGHIAAAIAATRVADLFVERVRLFQRSSGASVDIRQNGVILAKGVETNLVSKLLRKAFAV